MLNIGRHHYPTPIIALAPMVGITDLPFRRLCQKLGCHISIAEMINAHPSLIQTLKSQNRIQFDPDPNTPKIVQLAGGERKHLTETAKIMQDKGIDAIDFNLGCPAKKVGKQNAGAALLTDLKHLEQLLIALKKAITIPLSIKTRLGIDEKTPTLLELGKIAEQIGINHISVHGRTRAERFQGQAKYETIAELKTKTTLPIIVNGDINSAEKAQQLLDTYKFDGVMIGRAAQGNPWLFSEIRQKLEPNWQTEEKTRQQQILEHITALHQHYPQNIATLYARKHLLHYYPKARLEIIKAEDKDTQIALINKLGQP